MLSIPMRTVPSLFVGRRTLVLANEVNVDGAKDYHCGACETVIARASDNEAFRDVVVRCDCGEHNQI